MKASQGASGLTLVSAILATILFFGMISPSASAAPPPSHKTVWVMKMANQSQASTLTVSPDKAMGKLVNAGYQVNAVKSWSILSSVGHHMTMIRTKFVLVFSRIVRSITPGGGGNTCS